MRLLLALLWIGLSRIALAQDVTNNTQPWFCRNGPCPTYELLQTRPNYEIRLYSTNPWIQATAAASNYTSAFTNSFVPLFSYLNGFNQGGLNIIAGGLDLQLVNISSNVTTVTSNFLLLPAQLNGSTKPPQPLNQNLTLYNGYNGAYAVASFGGFADQAAIVSNSMALAGNLTADNLSFNPQIYFGIYDDPSRLTNRHNEIWYKLPTYNAGPAMAPAPRFG